MTTHDSYSYSLWLIEKSSCVFWAAISGETAAVLSPSPHLLLHHFIFLLKRIESLALLTHTNWNLTRVSKSFLFPTGAFRGYQTPARLTGDRFLSPFCFSSLHLPYSLVSLFVFPPAHWHLNFPSPLSLLPSSPSSLLSLSAKASIMFSQSRPPTPPCSMLYS